MKYKLGSIDQKKFVCVCADKSTAVFAPFKMVKDGDRKVMRTVYKNMYAKSQG